MNTSPLAHNKLIIHEFAESESSLLKRHAALATQVVSNFPIHILRHHSQEQGIFRIGYSTGAFTCGSLIETGEILSL
jgi:hypothetical protein